VNHGSFENFRYSDSYAYKTGGFQKGLADIGLENSDIGW